MSETKTRLMALSLPLLLIAGLSGCGQLPRYALSEPPAAPGPLAAEEPDHVEAFASTGVPVQWGFKGVRFEAIWQWEVSGVGGEHTLYSTEPEQICNFSVDLAGLLPETPRHCRGRPAGDVRSADVAVTRDDYPLLIEAWTLEGECGTSSYPVGPSIVARRATEPYVTEALASLRRESARRGADSVRDVRCFAMHDRYRLWCEGRAFATGS